MGSAITRMARIVPFCYILIAAIVMISNLYLVVVIITCCGVITVGVMMLQAIMGCNEAVLPSQTPAVQLQLRRLCLAHLLAAARFACFASRPQVLQAAAQACWNVCMPFTGSAEGRSIIADSVQTVAGLMCELRCQDTAFQVRSRVVLPVLN